MSSFKLTIPSETEAQEALDIELNQGESLFLLGANGTGKSSLMHLFYRTHTQKCVRISAHRQTWFATNAIALSPQDKRQNEQNIKSRDSQLQSRWKDEHAAIRASIAIYDLIDAENVRARTIAGAVDNQQIEEAVTLALNAAPIAVINELLELSGLPIKIFIRKNESIVATKNNSPEFSIAELSDGERNALLIAATILTAETDTLILVDEPERHLHRAIISPLLTQLFARRNDCAFIVSTHEALLPIDNKDSRTLLVRGCAYIGQNPSGWQVDVLDSAIDIPEDIKLDIYGARRKLLFVEGTEESLDKPLYGILFPDTTVISKGNCRDVERSTVGIRTSHELHWASAYGLVDSDGRDDTASLADQGICAVDSYSVESLYYHPQMLNFIAARRAEFDGIDPDVRVTNAIASAIRAIAPHRDRICAKIASRKLHEIVITAAPNPQQVMSGENISVDVPISEYFQRELQVFDEAIASSDYLKLVQRYPLRETPALNRVACELGFNSRKEYESSVLKACSDDESVREFIISLLGPLSSMLDTSSIQAAESPLENVLPA